MLYHKNSEYHISDLNVSYKENNKQLTNIIGSEGKGWWIELAKLHNDLEIIKFTDIPITDVELARLEEINQLNIPEGYSGVLGDYVHNNKFPDEANHILKDLENKKINESNQNYFVDLDFRMSMSEMGM